jgi:plastocyanin
MRVRSTLITIAAVALSIGAASCGGSTDANVTTPSAGNSGGTDVSANAVNIVDLTFSPAVLNVSAGTTVTWHWGSCNTGGGYGGGTCASHSVTFDDGSNIASPIQDSGTFSRTFATPGTYKYHCAVHGFAMTGEIDVK